MPNRAIVLDANILARAVLGRRVRELIETYSEQVKFFVPDAAYTEAEEHLSAIVSKRGNDPVSALSVLRAVSHLTEIVPSDVYRAFANEAKRRLATRDPEDWPILACALALNCPVWTEDSDFFGCGVAAWTSDRITIFLQEHGSGSDNPA